MSLGLTLGLGIIAAIFLALTFLLAEHHAIPKLLSLIWALMTVLLLVGHLMTTTQQCEILLNEEFHVYQYSDNYTSDEHWVYGDPSPAVSEINLFHENISYTYERVCFDTGDSTATSLYRMYDIYLYLIRWYIPFFAIFIGLDSVGLIDKFKRQLNKK